MLSPAELGAARRVAVEAAEAAAVPILELFRSSALGVEEKEDGSPVSEADKRAELILREHLRAAFPGVAILGEEGGQEGDGELRWVLDPIDGTLSFVRGVPLFGTLIGLEHVPSDTPLVGVLNLPALGECYSGARGQGCFCNEAPVRTEASHGEAFGAGDDLSHTIIAAGDPLQFEIAGIPGHYDQLSQFCTLFRGYTDAFGHAMVLRGAIGAMVDPGLNPWDLAASRLLVPEAGGAIFTRPSAEPGKLDAILGRPEIVQLLANHLGWE